MQQPITLHELQVALKKLKNEKSPRLDLITNKMLTHRGSAATNKLLEIFNHILQNGTLPQIWREATMIRVYKKRQEENHQLPSNQTHQLCCQDIGEDNQPTFPVISCN